MKRISCGKWYKDNGGWAAKNIKKIKIFKTFGEITAYNRIEKE